MLSVITVSVVALRTSPEWAYQGLVPTIKNVFINLCFCLQVKQLEDVLRKVRCERDYYKNRCEKMQQFLNQVSLVCSYYCFVEVDFK